MASGIWTAVSGAKATSEAIDVVSNNLANSQTPGFKKDTPSFKEYLATVERTDLPTDVPRLPIKDKDFYPLDGRDQGFVILDGTHTNFKQGHLQVTKAPLDLALNGPGFFEVSTPSGVRYTRQGSFKLTKDGQLVTRDGFPVLASQNNGLEAQQPAGAVVQPGQGRQPTQGGVAVEQQNTASRFINLIDFINRGERISITKEGDIYGGNQLVAKLGVAEFADTSTLKKEGGLLFENVNPENRPLAAQKTEVHQGMIESSNVNPAEEMVKLIKAQRMYEMDLKAMKTYDNLMQKVANEVGKL